MKLNDVRKQVTEMEGKIIKVEQTSPHTAELRVYLHTGYWLFLSYEEVNQIYEAMKAK